MWRWGGREGGREGGKKEGREAFEKRDLVVGSLSHLLLFGLSPPPPVPPPALPPSRPSSRPPSRPSLQGVLMTEACGSFAYDALDHCVNIVGYNDEAPEPYFVVSTPCPRPNHPMSYRSGQGSLPSLPLSPPSSGSELLVDVVGRGRAHPPLFEEQHVRPCQRGHFRHDCPGGLGGEGGREGGRGGRKSGGGG
jgi:hypothetical protein